MSATRNEAEGAGHAAAEGWIRLGQFINITSKHEIGIATLLDSNKQFHPEPNNRLVL